MKAIILAAGYATRLYPLTRNKPKALITICGKPIIDYICDEIETIEAVDEIIVISNHKFINHFNRWVGARTFTKKVKVLDDSTMDEETKLGAIGDIRLVLDRENIKDDILVIAGDNFFTFKLQDFYNYFLSMRKDCIIAQRTDKIEDLRRSAVALLDGNSKVVDMEEKPGTPKSNIAVYAAYIYLKETLPLFDVYLREGNKSDAPGYFPSWLYKKKDVYAYTFDGECYDIGTPEALAEVRKKFKVRSV